MQAPASTAAHDCFARPGVAELTIELATRRSRATTPAGTSASRAHRDRPGDRRCRRLTPEKRRLGWLGLILARRSAGRRLRANGAPSGRGYIAAKRQNRGSLRLDSAARLL